MEVRRGAMKRRVENLRVAVRLRVVRAIHRVAGVFLAGVFRVKEIHREIHR